MDINEFIALRNSSELDDLNEKIMSLISLLSNDKKSIKFKTNSINNNNILKNPKLQSMKDKIENKVNLILNKLSELNFSNLLTEFFELIGKVSESEYENVQKAFYLKIQVDINFLKIYLDFFKVISRVYKKCLNLHPKFFYEIVQTKFNNDYLEDKIYDKFEFLNNLNEENNRLNNLSIIRYMIQSEMFKPTIKNLFDKIILDQNFYFTDIYYWFQHDTLSKETKDIIKNKINNNTLALREKVLLDSLIDNNKQLNISNKTNDVKSDTIDTLDIETDNIIEEYLYMNSLTEIIDFVETRCKDAISKNKFCQFAFEKYFLTNNNDKILDLLKTLSRKQILYKSNLSRGILLIYNDWKEKSIDYTNPNDKIKNILLFLKNNGITNNLNELFNTYKI